jgi:hypothetical protein
MSTPLTVSAFVSRIQPETSVLRSRAPNRHIMLHELSSGDPSLGSIFTNRAFHFPSCFEVQTSS